MTKKEEKAMQVAEQQAIEKDDLERTRERPCFVPKTDIYETSEAIYLVADIPGVAKDAVYITLEKDVLTIDAYAAASRQADFSVSYSEYVPGDYHRQFRLPGEIDHDKISAVVAEGVLRLKLPKAEAVKLKKIPIKNGK